MTRSKQHDSAAQRDRVAARKAWLHWTDNEGYRGLSAGPFELFAESLSNAAHEEGTFERQETIVTPPQVSSDRQRQATKRDLDARQRDRVAEERDQAAAEHGPRVDQAVEALEELRAESAADRERAAGDREAAALDRENQDAALNRAHLDDLTGAYRREMGRIALVHEIERAHRSQGVLALAYFDLDGLKDVNDRDGHAAGDALLRDLVTSMRAKLRSYDPVVRWGGDEFICTISDADLEAARGRIEEIRKVLGEVNPGSSVSVGLATLDEGDTLETLTARADAALLDTSPGR